MDVFERIVEVRKDGRRAALATIVRRIGSTPRKDHAKMLVCDDGSCYGSVGGGCTEAEVWQTARRVIESGRAEMLRFDLRDEDAENEGLVCGGTVEILVEPILPEPRMILLGAGHVAQALAEGAGRLGFQVVVVDDRSEFANSERFPGATEIHVEDFRDCLRSVRVNANSFILTVTRGHRHDEAALESAIRAGGRYVGLIGSRRKIRLLVANLLKKGYPPQAFDALYAPIGIEIGSETPEEIAVSVLAELIALIKGTHQRSEKQLFIHRYLEKAKSEAVQSQSA